MKTSEFRKLIREEIKSLLEEKPDEEKKWTTAVMSAQEIAAATKLNYEDSWDAIVTKLIQQQGLQKIKKLVIDAEKLHKKYYL